MAATMDSVDALAASIVATDLRERIKAIPHGLYAIQAESARRGISGSSFIDTTQVAFVVESFQDHAKKAFDELIRVHGVVGRPQHPNLKQEFKRLFQKYLQNALEAYAGTMKPQNSMGQPTNSPRTELAVEIGELNEKYGAEIALYVAGLEAGQAPIAQHGVVMNFLAPVGAVMTGPSARAEVNQDLSTTFVTQMNAALDGVARAYKDQMPKEVAEVIQECRDMAASPKPNKLKLSGLLNGLATTVGALGSAEGAANALAQMAKLILG